MAQVPLVLAHRYGGANRGAQIQAANDDLGAAPGIIVSSDGDHGAMSQVVLSSDRTVILGKGTHEPDASSSAAGLFVFHDSCTIRGHGHGTIIKERNKTGQNAKAVFRDHGSWLGGSQPTDNDGNTDVVISDLQILGNSPDFDSAQPTVALGNSHRVRVERLFLNGTCSIGINAGGTSNASNHASDVTVRDCTFYHVASQNLSAVNCERFKFNDNTFIAAGQVDGPGATYIDIEPNTGTDRCTSFEVNGNLIHAIGSANLGNGILVQSGSGAVVGPGTVANNTINGGVFGTAEATTSYISNGIAVSGGVRGVQVIGNNVERAGQTGITLTTGDNPPTYCVIANNKLLQCGGGGIEALRVGGLHNVVRDNTLAFYSGSEAGSCGNWIAEEATGDYNLVYRNEIGRFFSNIGAIVMMGANSREFENTFDGIKARCFAADGAIVDYTLAKRGTTAGSAAQFTTGDVGSAPLGVCIGTPSSLGVAVVVTDRWNTRVPIKSDGAGTIAIGADIEPSGASNGRIKQGSTNKIGANEGALVAASADAICTAVLEAA